MQNFFETDWQFGRWLLSLVALIVFCILIQTYLMPYGLALLAMLLLFQWWYRPPQSLSHTLSLVLLGMSLVFCLGLLSNLIISQNLPTSIQAVMKWVVGLLVFMTAVLKPPTKPAQPLYGLSLLVICGVLGGLSLLTWVMPGIRVLPDMNFLYANFGHNHFSSLLLVILPWLIFADKVWPSRYWQWAVVIWTGWLVSTFSRLGLIVGLFELAVMAVWLRSQQHWWRFLTRWLGIVVIVLAGWLGLHALGLTQVFCTPKNYFSSRVCKNWQSEQRPEYWRQAMKSVQQNTWLGTGFETFSQVSLQYRKAPGSYSAHVHNDYLEWLVEAGWLGVVISSGLWGSWWLMRPRSADWFMRATWISTGVLLIVGLFEFDLQFVTYLFILLVGLGWLVGWRREVLQPKQKLIGFKILRWWLTGLTTMVVLWASIFLWLSLDWQYGAGQQFEKYGQYYSSNSLLLVKRWSGLNATKQAELLEFWKYDFRVLDFLIRDQSETFSEMQRQQLIAHFYVINPWSRQYYDLAQLQLNAGDFTAGRQTLEQTKNLAKVYQQDFGVTLHAEADELRWQQARHYRRVAEWEIQQGLVWQGLMDLTTAVAYEPWVLNDEKAAYCQDLKLWVRNQYNSDPVWQAQWSAALQVFDEINPAYFDNCATHLSLLALEQLKVQLLHDRCHGDSCAVWTRRALQWSQKAAWVTEFLARLRAQFPTQEF